MGSEPAELTMYVLDENGQPRHAKTLREWGEFFEKPNSRRVAEDHLPGGVWVSTVFLAMDHSWGDGPPVLWETMVFGGPLDGEEERYISRESALQGHAEMVDRCRKAIE